MGQHFLEKLNVDTWAKRVALLLSPTTDPSTTFFSNLGFWSSGEIYYQQCWKEHLAIIKMATFESRVLQNGENMVLQIQEIFKDAGRLDGTNVSIFQSCNFTLLRDTTHKPGYFY